MKRVLIVFAILLFAAAGLFAQIDYDAFGELFSDFASEIAKTLPSTAAVSGLNWSPAYIGEFPHFGVGASIGAFTIPYDFVEPLITDPSMNISLPSKFDYVEKLGMPIPAIALDARLGGFLLPFDVGVKVGYIPEKYRDKLTRIHADYRLFGGDARFRLLKGSGFLPTLSVGAGYTYLEGSVSVPDVGTTTEIDIPPLGVDPIVVTSPDLTFNFQTNTLMGKVQASWDLAILIPHIGLGAAYGLASSAGGGLTSEVLYQGSPLTDPAIIQDIKDYFAAAGYSIDQLDDTGVTISQDASGGFSFWLYGGTAVKLVFLAIDLSAMYNPISQAYGGAVNVRVQL
jgi:hypothetical protein